MNYPLFKKMDLHAQWTDEEYARSDAGRVFGWWLRLREERIAELNYRRWESDGQFWHEYWVVSHSEKFTEIGFDPNRWCEKIVSAESRYALGYCQVGIFMAPREGNVVSIRSLSIPKNVFERTLSALAPTPLLVAKKENA